MKDRVMNILEFAEMIDCMTDEECESIKGKLIVMDGCICGYHMKEDEGSEPS